MYVVNGSDGRCLVAVRLIAGVRYLERPLREVLLYMTKIFRRCTISVGLAPLANYHSYYSNVSQSCNLIGRYQNQAKTME